MDWVWNEKRLKHDCNMPKLSLLPFFLELYTTGEMMKKLMILSLITSIAATSGFVFAQTADSAKADGDAAAAAHAEEFTKLKGTVDGLNESFLETKNTVDKLAKIKVGGYLQIQWQHADSNAIENVAGGKFGGASNQRFQLRRGRLKTTYDAGTSQYILEFEARPSGVSLKDAEVVLKEPWLNSISATLGLMDRPFGFELAYSSSALESPERTRVYQTLFKDEKDLGFKIEVNPSEQMGFLQYLNLKGGLYTGTGGFNGGNGDEIDSTTDFIGRAGFKAPFNDLNLAIDGGISYYQGYLLGVNDTLYTMSGKALNSGLGAKNKTFDRNILGVDAQIYYSIPVIGDYLGGTSIRGEYLAGKNIGTIASSLPYGAASAPMAERNFMGWYVTWIQNWGTKLQSVLKYDEYDPNTDIEGSDVLVIANGKLTATDLKYTTLGFGANYFWDSNVKISAYYDIVTNEKAFSGPFSSDLADNILTLRAQVKF